MFFIFSICPNPSLLLNSRPRLPPFSLQHCQTSLLTASAESTQYVVVFPVMSRGKHLPHLPASIPPPPSFSIQKLNLTYFLGNLFCEGLYCDQWLMMHSSWCNRKQNNNSRCLRSPHHPDVSTPNQRANSSTHKFTSSLHGLLATATSNSSLSSSLDL